MNFSEKESRILTIAVYAQFFLLMLQLLIYKLLGTESNALIHMCIMIMCAVLMIGSFFIWIKKKFMNTVMVYIFIVFIFISQAIIFPENIRAFFNFGFYMLCMCIPCFINMTMIQEDIHVYYLQKFSILIFLAGIIYFMLQKSGLHDGGVGYSYSMSYSYYMLLPALVFVYVFFREKMKRYLFAAVICVGMICLIGSRGPVVCWCIFVVFLLCFAKNYRNLKYAAFVFIVLMFVFKSSLLGLLESIVNYMGVNSRTVNLIISGKFITHSSGRDEIWSKVIDVIKSEPIIGSGIGADFTIWGGYTHNFILDVLLHFGIIIGAVLLIGLMIMMLIAFCRAKNKELYGLLMCYGFVPLMVSGTYLTSAPFWIFMGYCVYCLDIKVTWGDSAPIRCAHEVEYIGNGE